MYTLDDIMEIYKNNEFPDNKDIYGRNAFAIHQRNFPGRYERRLHQLKRIGIKDFSFHKQQIDPKDLAEFRLGGFEGLLKYYKEYLTKDNFLTCKEARIKHAIKAKNLQNNATLESIKKSIRSGEMKETNMIGFEKKGIRIIQDGTQRALAITQMLKNGEKVPTKINRYVHFLDDNTMYPYIDYYPEKE